MTPPLDQRHDGTVNGVAEERAMLDIEVAAGSPWWWEVVRSVVGAAAGSKAADA